MNQIQQIFMIPTNLISAIQTTELMMPEELLHGVFKMTLKSMSDCSTVLNQDKHGEDADGTLMTKVSLNSGEFQILAETNIATHPRLSFMFLLLTL